MARKNAKKTGDGTLRHLLTQAREARDSMGLNNADIGRGTGIGTGQVGAVLSGRRNATFHTLALILAAVGLKLCLKPIVEGNDNG